MDHFTFPSRVYIGSLCTTSLRALAVSCSLMIATLSVKRYPTVVLICFSLMISYIDHLVMCLLAILMSSLEKKKKYTTKHLFSSFFPFLNQIGYFYVIKLHSFLNIFWIITAYLIECLLKFSPIL